MGEPGQVADPRLAAWRALLLASNAALRAIEADVQRVGRIPLTWYDVLLELNAGPDHRLRMQEVAERVVLSRTRVSRLVDEMVDAGLVRKEADSGDGRGVWAVITPEGRQALRETAPVYLSGIEHHFAKYLTDDELDLVAHALIKVVGAHDKMSGRCRVNPRRGAKAE
jgi:DNA-binding MarR family transcriptional regulator